MSIEHCASSRQKVLAPSLPERHSVRNEPPRTRTDGAPAVSALSSAWSACVLTSSRIMSPTEPPIAKKQKISMMHHKRRQYVLPASKIKTLHALA
eukprot:scaffold52601_cov32-Tisochrysis_lutea.AAC.3